ncbi:hypothetical protein F5Y14DRAFT_458603 [Nemania sp. NC0429]|nr:hypothetical protein F5Y14DRAFT_458603 [Nemania sp. NC0429]
MPPQPLSNFRIGEDEITEVPATYEACRTDVERTAFLIEKLRVCQFNYPRYLLEQTQQVLRLWKPKKIKRNGAVIDAPVEFNDNRRATALALYMFAGDEAQEACRQCASKQSTGPAHYCVVAKGHMNGLRGACTNCSYSGNGTRCSIRVDEENAEKENELPKRSEFQGSSRRCWRS